MPCSPCDVPSFLLHRPYVRLDELPLFDTLFTGVQQGEGGRDGGMGGVGDALGATSTSDPAAATTKARAWMLRALRDGEQIFSSSHIRVTTVG